MEAQLNIAEGVVGSRIDVEFNEILLPDGSLGEHDASKNGKMAGKKVHSATISSLSKVIDWGLFDGQPACFLGLELYFNSTADHSLKQGSYELELVETKTISATSTYMYDFRPVAFQGKLTSKEINQNLTASPNVSAGNVQISIGSASLTSSYTKERAFKITGSPMADDEDEEDEPLCKGIEWKLQENSIQKTGVKEHLRVAVLIRHEKKPFVIESRADGRTGSWGEKPKYLLSKKKTEPILRIFYPPQTTSKVLTIQDLEEFVNVALST